MDMTNVDFKKLWTAQKAEQPGMDDLRLKIDAYRKSGRKQLMLTNLGLGSTAVMILFIWYYYEPQFVTTKIGIVAIIAAIGMYVIAISQHAVLFKKADEATSNQLYLKNLLAIKTKQQFIQTTILNLYFVLLSAGIALYMYEYASRMTTVWAIVTYGITGTWILFNWFYLRPKQVRKQQTRLNELIGKLERIQVQLNQE